VLRSGLWSGQWEESRGEVTPSKNHCKFTTIVFTDYIEFNSPSKTKLFIGQKKCLPKQRVHALRHKQKAVIRAPFRRLLQLPRQP
jgi:hypothetical protein